MSDAYKIGISVVLGNLMSAELLKIIGQLGVADKVAIGFAGKVSLIGAAVTVLGLALADGVKEAARFQVEATKFSTLGFGDAVNEQAQSFAKGMNTVGTSATENMALLSDAMAVFKDLGQAEMAAPLMAKMKFGNETIYGSEQGGSNDRKFMDMLKVIEFRGGLKSQDEFETQANFVQKVINGSRNRVDATQMLNAMKTGGVALAGMQNEAFYLGSEPLIQEFGGQRFGSGASAIYQNLIQMRSSQRSLTEMLRLGLLDPSKVTFNKMTGQVKSANSGAFRGGDTFTSEGPLAFLEKVLLPAFAKKGITDDKDIIMELGAIMGNPRGSGLLARTYQQRMSLHNQADANKSAMDINATSKAAEGTLPGQMKELEAQWQTLEARIGLTILPTLISVLKSINDGFRWLETSPMIPKIFNALEGPGQQRSASSSVSWWKSALGLGSVNPVPQPSTQAPIVIDHTTTLDGRTIANSTTQYQIDGMAKAPSSGTSFDGRLGLLSVN